MTFCLLLLKADTPASQSLGFFTVQIHKLITVKDLEFYPAHFELLVTNG
jgi:hypothetical protein